MADSGQISPRRETSAEALDRAGAEAVCEAVSHGRYSIFSPGHALGWYVIAPSGRRNVRRGANSARPLLARWVGAEPTARRNVPVTEDHRAMRREAGKSGRVRAHRFVSSTQAMGRDRLR